MRRAAWIGVAAILALLLAWTWALALRPHAQEPIHNAYWPFSVETSVRDR